MEKKMTFNYFYGTEADQFSFYRIPKALFTDSYFKDLSSDAKILYLSLIHISHHHPIILLRLPELSSVLQAVLHAFFCDRIPFHILHFHPYVAVPESVLH